MDFETVKLEIVNGAAKLTLIARID